MSTLKTLKNRRESVKSTKKITLAMKMVAGAKLRRAQERVEAVRPYAHLMERMLTDLASRVQALETPQPLLTGTGQEKTYLIVVATSNRGLCGGFNSSITRHVRKKIEHLQGQGLTVKLLCVGTKGRDILKREFIHLMLQDQVILPAAGLRYGDAEEITSLLCQMYEAGEFDRCLIVYNSFISAMTQEVTVQQLIPLKVETVQKETSSDEAIYEYEPSEAGVLSEILPRNLAIQVYTALLENGASEQGARMTAMDNATRNAEDMIKSLALTYNRMRQAHITKELIEIISGAEAI